MLEKFRFKFVLFLFLNNIVRILNPILRIVCILFIYRVITVIQVLQKLLKEKCVLSLQKVLEFAVHHFVLDYIIVNASCHYQK